MAAAAVKTPVQKPASSSSGNTAKSLQVSLPQLLDLALGTPETLITSSKKGPSLHLHEFSITDGSGKVKNRIHSNDNVTINADIYTDADLGSETGKRVTSAPSTARTTGTKTESKNGTVIKKVRGLKQRIDGEIEGDFESVIFVEPVMDGATPTTLSFKKLEDSVQQLRDQFGTLEKLATNQELIERIRGNSTDPLTDMWQIISINKRLDASEQGISKLTSILQDIIKDGKVEIQTTEGGDVGIKISSELAQIEQRLSDLEASIASLYAKDVQSSGQDDHIRSVTGGQDLAGGVVRPSPGNDVIMAGEEEAGRSERDEMIDNRSATHISGKPIKKPSFVVNFDGIREDLNNLKNVMDQIQNDIRELQSKMIDSQTSQGLKSGTTESRTVINEEDTIETGVKITNSEVKKPVTITRDEDESKVGVSATSGNEADERKLDRCLESIQKLETKFVDTIRELNNRIQVLENRATKLVEGANNDASVDNGSPENEQVNLETKLKNMQCEVEKLSGSYQTILERKKELDSQITDFQKQIELLKIVKADKEDLEGALADKADARAVNRKVSYDRFDATCDDITRSLGEAIAKLSQQEAVWQQSLDEIQQEMGAKLDKVEFSPLKEFVDNKVKILQEKVKVLSDMKEENEAAGTKRMLRNVQCLSCDKNVVMRKEKDNLGISAPGMPCTKVIRAYVAHRMDQVSRQQKRSSQEQNLMMLGAVLRENKNSKMKEDTLVETRKRYLCNRYCGGSHTIITPQQRVMKIGHFNNQWGLQVIQLSDDYVEGSDGQMYRGRPIIDHLSSEENRQVTSESCNSKYNDQQKIEENPVSADDRVNRNEKRNDANVNQREVRKSSVLSRSSAKGATQIIAFQEHPPPPSREQSLTKTSPSQFQDAATRETEPITRTEIEEEVYEFEG